MADSEHVTNWRKLMEFACVETGQGKDDSNIGFVFRMATYIGVELQEGKSPLSWIDTSIERLKLIREELLLKKDQPKESDD